MGQSLKDGFKEMFSRKRPLAQTDPEFYALFNHFAYDEVIHEPGASHPDLDDRTRAMAVLAALMGCQGVDEYRDMLVVALGVGVTPVEIKEIVYQGTAYLGFGRTLPFLRATNEVFDERDIPTPQENQGTVGPETRMAKGEEAQIAIFGEGMRGFAQSGPEETRHIHKWLVDNCFGDYYTRGGLDLRQREMITFCFIAAQGGCEPQLTAHAKGNMNVGNDRMFLIALTSQIMPYIGYPRTLNALACVDKARD